MSRWDYEDFDSRGPPRRSGPEPARLEAGVRGVPPARRVDRGPRAGPDHGPGTDLKVGVAGRHFIAADGEHNMPDGEFFTGPVEDSAEGEVTFHLPATYAGREVAGVRLPSRAARSSTRAPSAARSS